MKLYAQNGHQPSDKVIKGLEKNFIDGCIYSPRYIKQDKISEKIQEALTVKKDTEIYIDPEFYATRHSGVPNCQLGKLEDWEHFIPQRRRDLVTTNKIEMVLNKSYEIIGNYNVTGIIAPNIYISKSFDSMEAGISMNFIAQTKKTYNKLKIKKPVYATLAVDYQAIQNSSELINYLNDITALDELPDGFYVLIGRGLIDEKNDIPNLDISSVISGWMYINYILSINGYKVINGYSDVFSVFLGAVGGSAGATGWWSNLRQFSLGRYIRSDKEGGRLPNFCYLSNCLVNRIKMEERDPYSKLIPKIINGLSIDKNYDERKVDRTTEILQTWEAIQSLNKLNITDNIGKSLQNIEQNIKIAIKTCSDLAANGFSENYEANCEYLESLIEGITSFKRLAEI